jgi:hypothetical protein
MTHHSLRITENASPGMHHLERIAQGASLMTHHADEQDAD